MRLAAWNSESLDGSLTLPGEQDALVSALAEGLPRAYKPEVFKTKAGLAPRRRTVVYPGKPWSSESECALIGESS